MFRKTLGKIGALRVRAWESRSVTLRGIHDGKLLDEYDQSAEHTVIKRGDEIVAAARVTIHNPGSQLPDGLQWSDAQDGKKPTIACLSRLVVSEESRCKGYAQRLDGVRIALAIELSCSCLLACTSNPTRVSALQAQGFHVVRATPSTVTGLPATVMRRCLSA